MVVSDRLPWQYVPDSQKRLVVQVVLRLGDGLQIPIMALVDTGAEVNLLRKGLVDERDFVESDRPRRFVTANQELMDGGLVEVPCTLFMEGVDMDTGRQVWAECPITFYDANVGVDALLSYEWLRKEDIDVQCRNHGLLVNREEGPIWVPGEVDPVRKGSPPMAVNRISGHTPGEEGPSDSMPKENYTVRWPFFQEVVFRLGMQPTLDCFATKGNERCSLYYTAEDNALAQVWADAEVMWINPPWRLWPEVAEKILASKCGAVCILPAWSKDWVQKLCGAASKRYYFEAGVRMFEIEGKPVPNTLWGVWA